ncbi:MAG: PEP-CTERM sorting domain-containing protein [Fimbriimonadaceae bacterium]|nr:PEP-CTERM sorting domain-containing protein [Fimbriimonadaceae bacterium]QYK55269.1 MAG: PEP-CTERM sorting domain-containing protein [Fimbriimonadaceae bacterium]
MALLASARAQNLFVNPGFETGNFNGWTQRNTPSGGGAPGQVTSFDVTGGGASLAARYIVGNTQFTGTEAGIELVQNLNLTGGVQYSLGFDFAVENTGGPNAQGGRFSIIVNGTELSAIAVEQIGGNQIVRNSVAAIFTPGTTGVYEVGARITRRFEPSIGGLLRQYADNFQAVPEPTTVLALAAGLALLKRRRR